MAEEVKKKQEHDLLMEFLRESNNIEDERSHEALIDAKYAWDYLIKFDMLTPDNLLSTHYQLMARLNPAIAGKLRTVNVRVGHRVCPSFDSVPRLLTQWFMNHHNAADEDKIKKAHIAFEKVHPFQDGNGRVGRIIMNWQRVKAELPLLIIHEGEEQNEYYSWFH